MKEIIQQLQSLGSRSLEENVRLCGRFEAELNRRKRFYRISFAVHLLSLFLAVELLIADCCLYLSDDLTNEDLWVFLADIYGMFPLNKTSLIVLTGVLVGILLFLPMVLDRVFANVCENLPERKSSSRMNDALRTSGVDGKLQYIKNTLDDCFVECDFSCDCGGWYLVFGYAVEITGIPLCRWLVGLFDSDFVELIGDVYILFGGMLFGVGFCAIDMMQDKRFLNKRLSVDRCEIIAILKTYDVYAEKVRLDAMSPEERRQFMEEKARCEREEEERKRKERAEEAKVMLWALNKKASFDADSYVSQNCTSYIYGIASEDDIKKIENDSSLTSSQKEAAKSELKHKSDMYY